MNNPFWYKFVNGKVFPCKDINDLKEAFSADRKIDRTEISEDCTVSTVFLGLDHGITLLDADLRAPVLFETMIFGGDHDGQTYRYSTFGEAKRGHWFIVKILREGKKPEGGFNLKKMLDDLEKDISVEDNADWWKAE
jgi:hypothetical protein